MIRRILCRRSQTPRENLKTSIIIRISFIFINPKKLEKILAKLGVFINQEQFFFLTAIYYIVFRIQI
jgi:hypothetical protein